jgi:predicted O-methyltransferase YrrM
MDFLSPELNTFVESHTRPESDVLKRLNRETYAKMIMPRMLSGHLQGQVLRMLSMMIKPKRILEIGTFTGYSAICLSDGLTEGGLMHTIDINEEYSEIVNRYFKEAGVENKIKRHIGNALDIIPSIKESFDLVFIDADKENYSNYFDLVFDKVPKGGYILADNVLWSGKVLENQKDMDTDTKAIVAYCDKIQKDERVENVLFPIRDGIMVARKIV